MSPAFQLAMVSTPSPSPCWERPTPVGVVLAAILFGAMRNGATRMQLLTQIPVDIISVIQALILLFVAADAIIRYHLPRARRRRTRSVDTGLGRLRWIGAALQSLP